MNSHFNAEIEKLNAHFGGEIEKLNAQRMSEYEQMTAAHRQQLESIAASHASETEKLSAEFEQSKAQLGAEIQNREYVINEKNGELSAAKAHSESLTAALEQSKQELEERNFEIGELGKQINEKNAMLQERDKQIYDLVNVRKSLEAKTVELDKQRAEAEQALVVFQRANASQQRFAQAPQPIRQNPAVPVAPQMQPRQSAAAQNSVERQYGRAGVQQITAVPRVSQPAAQRPVYPQQYPAPAQMPPAYVPAQRSGYPQQPAAPAYGANRAYEQQTNEVYRGYINQYENK